MTSHTLSPLTSACTLSSLFRARDTKWATTTGVIRDFLLTMTSPRVAVVTTSTKRQVDVVNNRMSMLVPVSLLPIEQSRASSAWSIPNDAGSITTGMPRRLVTAYFFLTGRERGKRRTLQMYGGRIWPRTNNERFPILLA